MAYAGKPAWCTLGAYSGCNVGGFVLLASVVISEDLGCIS